jgi:pyruvate-ferredoxin/flavodoxin oxidoreductase
MVKGVFDLLTLDDPKPHFTVGINDDVTHLSIDLRRVVHLDSDDVVQAVFFGLGADGTVGANKNSIKIIGEETRQLRAGLLRLRLEEVGRDDGQPPALRAAPDQVDLPHQGSANFVACHQFNFLEKYEVLDYAAPGATFLLNARTRRTRCGTSCRWRSSRNDHREEAEGLHDRRDKVAAETGMGRRVNTIMQTCFFAVSGVLPRDEAIAKIKESITKTYAKKGDEVVRRNFEAVDATLDNMHELNPRDRRHQRLPPTAHGVRRGARPGARRSAR